MNLSFGKYTSLVLYLTIVLFIVCVVVYLLHSMGAGFWLSATVWLVLGLGFTRMKRKWKWLSDLDEGKLIQTEVGNVDISIFKNERRSRSQTVILLSIFALWYCFVVLALLWWQPKAYLLLPASFILLAIVFDWLEKHWRNL